MEVMVRNRLVTVSAAAAVVIAGVSGCGGSFQTVPRKPAHLTLGTNTHTTRPPACKQDQQYRTIDIRDGAGQVEAVVLQNGERAIPQWVKIRDIDGFDGSFWQGGVGDANVDLVHGTYTITGSAYGIAKSNPDKVVTTDFKITADC
jgi:hypothetical protein